MRRCVSWGARPTGPRDSAKSPAETYDIGCQVGLRVAGVIASRAVGHGVAGSPEMCPMGLIVVLSRSAEEWVVHPDGCEIVEIQFHYELLRTYLEQTPLAARMLMPRMPGGLERRAWQSQAARGRWIRSRSRS